MAAYLSICCLNDNLVKPANNNSHKNSLTYTLVLKELSKLSYQAILCSKLSLCPSLCGAEQVSYAMFVVNVFALLSCLTRTIVLNEGVRPKMNHHTKV